MILSTQKERDNCYGCYACANVCPPKCIALQEDNEGFRMPVIDTEHCTDCGLCDKVCPIGKSAEQLHGSLLAIPYCYVGYALDEHIRKFSASGGLSYLLSKKIIEEGGVVFGVVGDATKEVFQCKAETIDELLPFCGSKYVQSNVRDCFKQAKAALKQGQKVLFTGTPCQIAGLYGFLGKEYPNLYTLDLICHGVPSHKVLRKYLQEQEAIKGKKIVRFARDKSQGYYPPQYSILYEGGEKENCYMKYSFYRQGFNANLFQRKSCFLCQYASIPRIADFSVGDIFFDGLYLLEHDNNNWGVTLITINSEKGKSLFSSIESGIVYEEYPLQTALKRSSHLAHAPHYHKNRTQFFKDFEVEGFFVAAERHLRVTRFVKLIRLVRRVLSKIKRTVIR